MVNGYLVNGLMVIWLIGYLVNGELVIWLMGNWLMVNWLLGYLRAGNVGWFCIKRKKPEGTQVFLFYSDYDMEAFYLQYLSMATWDSLWPNLSAALMSSQPDFFLSVANFSMPL